jgi:hypothetical protein
MSDKDQEDRKERRSFENDDLVIEDNTIYEVDLDCYECLRRERKKIENKNNS